MIRPIVTLHAPVTADRVVETLLAIAADGCAVHVSITNSDFTFSADDGTDEPPATTTAATPAAPAPSPRGTAVTDDDLLAALREHGPVTAADLAGILGLASTMSVGQRLAKLKGRGIAFQNTNREWHTVRDRATHPSKPTPEPATEGLSPPLDSYAQAVLLVLEGEDEAVRTHDVHTQLPRGIAVGKTASDTSLVLAQLVRTGHILQPRSGFWAAA